MRINPDRIIGFIFISLALASGIVLILITRIYQDKLRILWDRYEDPDLARQISLVFGIALVVGSVLFLCSSCCWLCIFDTADQEKKRRYRIAQQRKLAKTKSAERQVSEQSRASRVTAQSAAQVSASQSGAGAAAGGSGGSGTGVTPSAPPPTAPFPGIPISAATAPGAGDVDVHDPLMFVRHPPPYESIIMQECMKFPFADEV